MSRALKLDLGLITLGTDEEHLLIVSQLKIGSPELGGDHAARA